jgi:hypothetical protein
MEGVGVSNARPNPQFFGLPSLNHFNLEGLKRAIAQKSREQAKATIT